MIYSSVQDRQVSLLQNISTVASLFSAVSATTLQYNGSAGFTFAQSFNLCWVLSLILSTVCAVHCQLVIYWQSSTSRLPISRVTAPILINVTHVPPILLGSSACSFLIGLVFFVFAACDQHQRYFSVVATVGVCLALTYLASFIMWVVASRSNSGHRPDPEGSPSPITPPGPVPASGECSNGFMPMAPALSYAERTWAPVEEVRQPMIDVRMPMAPPLTHAERMWAPVEGERQRNFLVYY